MTLNIDWKNIHNEKPEIDRAVWICTFQDHINLAWMLSDEKFYHYGDLPFRGCSPAFLDKNGDCNVIAWDYADIPNPVDIDNEEWFEIHR